MGSLIRQQARKTEVHKQATGLWSNEFGLRGQRAQERSNIPIGGKYCFKTPERTCVPDGRSPNVERDSRCRIDLIEREGDKARACNCSFPSPVPEGRVKITIDQGAAYRIPYVGALPIPASRPISPTPGYSRKWRAAKAAA